MFVEFPNFIGCNPNEFIVEYQRAKYVQTVWISLVRWWLLNFWINCDISFSFFVKFSIFFINIGVFSLVGRLNRYCCICFFWYEDFSNFILKDNGLWSLYQLFFIMLDFVIKFVLFVSIRSIILVAILVVLG